MTIDQLNTLSDENQRLREQLLIAEVCLGMIKRRRPGRVEAQSAFYRCREDARKALERIAALRAP